MPRTIVITGGGGFVGQWLARAALSRGDAVILGGMGPRPSAPAVLTSAEWSQVRWVACDVTHASEVDSVISSSVPTAIVHLAGLSSVPKVEKNPREAYEVNVMGAVHVAHAAARVRLDGKADPVLLVVGSATQYGIHPTSEMPLAETAEQRPVNTYAATKAAQEIATLQIGRATGLRVVCTRSFNHSGVGHDHSFLLPSLVSRVVHDRTPVLQIGNDAVRDYLHVTDVAAAYLALLDRGNAGEVYNVCSGKGVSVREAAAAVLSRAGVNTEVRSDPALQRTTDMPVLIGSPEKLIRDTGWAPRKTYLDIIDDLLAATRPH
jgi:GDP-4-dehydro-6-deoxy-D-mannose reductase